MTNKMIFVGEIKIGDKGCIHQTDFAEALGAERLTAIPKQLPPMGSIAVVVGRLLRGKEPALLKQAKSRGLPVTTVDDVMNDAVRTKLIALLTAKAKRETYEQLALDHLQAAKPPKSEPDHTVLGGVFPLPGKPKRGGGKKKAAANE